MRWSLCSCIFLHRQQALHSRSRPPCHFYDRSSFSGSYPPITSSFSTYRSRQVSLAPHPRISSRNVVCPSFRHSSRRLAHAQLLSGFVASPSSPTGLAYLSAVLQPKLPPTEKPPEPENASPPSVPHSARSDMSDAATRENPQKEHDDRFLLLPLHPRRGTLYILTSSRRAPAVCAKLYVCDRSLCQCLQWVVCLC